MDSDVYSGSIKPPRQGAGFLLPKIEQTRKLITKILRELKKRKKPPSPFNAYVVRTDNSFENDIHNPQNIFNTDETCDLLSQLKDVLVVCNIQGIKFAEKTPTPSESPNISRDASPNQSRSTSPLRKNRNKKKSNSGILYKILEVFYDIVQNDCRYKVHNPRPLRPPNALHLIVLDVAHLLINQNSSSPSWLYEIGMTMIPGFNCFIAIEIHWPDSDGSSLTDMELSEDELIKYGNKRKGNKNSSKRLSISYTGEFDIDAYYVDSLFTPLLFSIIQFIRIENSSLETLHQMHKTLGIMIQRKPDLYLDIIEIIALGDSNCRKLAINILFHFWENSTGHPAIGESLPTINYFTDLKIKEKEKDNHSSIIMIDKHEQFLPTDIPNACVQCFKSIIGFGIRSEYSLIESGVHKLSTPRYCNVKHGPRELISINQNVDSKLPIISKFIANHKFRFINLFTLTLCMICRLPLWGIMYQGYRCEICNRFIHSSCLNLVEKEIDCQQSILSENDALINHEILRESFKNYYKQILIPEEKIINYTYEELSVMVTILQMQNNLLNNGIMAGCLIVKQKFHNPLSPRNEKFKKFELQEFIEIYETYLRSGKISLTTISEEYWESVGKKYNPWIISCEDYLAHISAAIKSRIDFDYFNNNDHLSVNDGILTSIELIQWMKKNLGMLNEYSIKIFLQQMSNHGFLERIDGNPILFPSDDNNNHDENSENLENLEYSFPLPFATECSPTVEALITSISACLSDINISINECGFLLMTRRCWPDPYISKYVLERLIYSIIEWICNEDDKLLIIAREYTSAQIKLPGVRDEMENVGAGVGVGGKAGSSGGGAYLISRRMLKEKYVINWLLTIHDMDEELFCNIIFEQIGRMYENQRQQEELDDDDNNLENVFHNHDRVLRCIIKLYNSDLLFSSYNHILSRWLDEACVILRDQSKVFVEFKTLYKMFSSIKTISRQRTASIVDHMAISTEINNKINIMDPIEIITRLFVENDFEKLSRALHWIELMVRSSIGLNGSVFSEYCSHLSNISLSLEQSITFLQSMWYQVIIGLGHLITRGIILEIVSNLNELNFEIIKKINDEGYEIEIESARNFIKISLVLALYAYSCPLDGIHKLGIVELPRANITAETPLMKCLLSYARFDKLDVRGDVIKAFWQFFISAGLAPIHDPLSTISMPLLIRMVWADSRFFLASVSKVFEHESWEVRFDGLDNLFGLFSKLDEKYDVQRAGVFAYLGPVFSYLVDCLWDKEEFVRTKAITYIRSMQPQHVRLAFKCWEGYFRVSSNREKTLLCRLMIKLNEKFPNWQEIEEEEMAATTEILESYVRPDSVLVVGLKHFQEEEPINQATGQKIAEKQNLKVTMLNLALQMLANGIEINKEQIIKLKFVVVSNLGFTDYDFIQNMMMISCLGNLKKVLDRPIYLRNSNKTNNHINTEEIDLEDELAGGYFVDVIFSLINSSVDMSKLSHLMFKIWIELLLIVIYKHKIEDRRNRDFEETLANAMRKISELLLEDNITEENKQLTIELATSLLKRAPMLTVNILGKQIVTLGKLLTRLGNNVDTNNGSLAMSAKTFLRSAFLKFARNGLFVLIFKNQTVAEENKSSLDMFKVLRDVIRDEQIPNEDESQEPTYLRDEPIRDVFNQLFKFTNRKIVSTILCNLNKYVEKVYSKPYNEQLIFDLGQFLIKLTKHTSEWKTAEWDINPVINMGSIVMIENPIHAK
ncbi:8345_t:CDS:10, partial [Diversispora eburnea]